MLAINSMSFYTKSEHLYYLVIKKLLKGPNAQHMLRRRLFKSALPTTAINESSDSESEQRLDNEIERKKIKFRCSSLMVII